MLRRALNALREPSEREVSKPEAQLHPAADMAQPQAEAQAVRSANPRAGTRRLGAARTRGTHAQGGRVSGCGVGEHGDGAGNFARNYVSRAGARATVIVKQRSLVHERR